jgi:multidrug efflux pump subunit AcrB
VSGQSKAGHYPGDRGVKADRIPQLHRNFPGVTWTFEGSNAETRRATASLSGWFGLALAVIYTLLAIASRSCVQPLIVLSAIPFWET